MILSRPSARPSPVRDTTAPLPPGVVLREYHENDHADVLRLYHEGMLSEAVNAPDPATDPRFIFTTYQSRPQDHLWVADLQGKVIATIGVTESENQVAHIRRLRVDRDFQQWENGQLIRTLVATAASHAQSYDYLKLVIHTPVHDERAIGFLHQLGFEFARIRDGAGRHLLEFYLNIYQPAIANPVLPDAPLRH